MRLAFLISKQEVLKFNMAVLAQIQRQVVERQWFLTWPDTLSMLLHPLLKRAAGFLAILCVLAFMGELISGYAEYKDYITPETSSWFRISKDRSLGEYAGYILQELCIAFVLLAGIRLASPIHYVLAGFMQFICLDDAFQFHEQLGEILGARYFMDGNVLRAQDLGELTYFIIVMAIGGLALLVALLKSTRVQTSLFLMLLMPFVLAAGCAVGLDLLHASVPKSMRLLGGVVAAFEDTGELVAFSSFLLLATSQWMIIQHMSPRPLANRFPTGDLRQLD